MKPTQGWPWHEILSGLELETLFNNLPFALYLKTIQGKFIYMNTLLSEEAGFTHNRKKTITDYDMPWKHQAEEVLKQEQTAIEFNREVELQLGDYCLKRQILRDKNQNPLAILGSYYLLIKKESIFNLEEIIESLPGHVFWKNTDCILQGCNEQQAKDSGFASREEIVGKTAYDLLWQDQSEEEKRKQAAITDQIDISIMKSNIAKAVEESVLLPDGSLQYFWSLKKPLHDKTGKVNGLLGVSLDITERKNLEEALKIAKEKAEAANYIMTEFIANMGHDLATPISDLGSVAQMLHYYADEYPEFKEFFETLVARSEVCEQVRKRIINATSLSNLDVQLESFSVLQELLELEKQFRPAIESKPLKLIIHPIKPKKDDRIMTDRSKLHAILVDLLSNAINFTEEGQITITPLKQKEWFRIQIKDTGIGIPADKYGYIFEQYTKLSRSNKYGSAFKGVGAGLFLAKVRATILGGSIGVESAIGKGSTFTLSIPVYPVKK